MKTATYRLTDGSKLTVEYDENAPCIECGLPVIEASMGGTVLCPWCDCGVNRDGTPRAWDFRKWRQRMIAAQSGVPGAAGGLGMVGGTPAEEAPE